MPTGFEWNYLRVRGEYDAMRVTGAQPLELPPRARRIRRSERQKGNYHGTTSACAENTGGGLIGLEAPRNYLRVRGEYNDARAFMCHLEELPPRARRIPHKRIGPLTDLGTTSACAENTKH